MSTPSLTVWALALGAPPDVASELASAHERPLPTAREALLVAVAALWREARQGSAWAEVAARFGLAALVMGGGR